MRAIVGPQIAGRVIPLLDMLRTHSTDAQKPLCEEHVPCFLGTKYLRKVANIIGSAPNVLTRATGHCAHCAISGATERFVNAARIGLVAAQNPEARGGMQNRNAGMRTRAPYGMHPASQLGSPVKCSCKK